MERLPSIPSPSIITMLPTIPSNSIAGSPNNCPNRKSHIRRCPLIIRMAHQWGKKAQDISRPSSCQGSPKFHDQLPPSCHPTDTINERAPCPPGVGLLPQSSIIPSRPFSHAS